jgi:predicted DNA-binding protein YlxM (UPF0122 family)
VRALDRVEAGLLFDLYEGLLTSHQREVWQLYYLEDWSLAEIGEREGISRAAVYDLLERTERSLWEYERRLGLFDEWQHRRQLLASLVGAMKKLPQNTPGLDEVWPWVRQLAAEEGLEDV